MPWPVALIVSALIIAAAIAWQQPVSMTAHPSGRIVYQAQGASTRLCWYDAEKPALDLSGLSPVGGGAVPRTEYDLRCSEWR